MTVTREAPADHSTVMQGCGLFPTMKEHPATVNVSATVVTACCVAFTLVFDETIETLPPWGHISVAPASTNGSAIT